MLPKIFALIASISLGGEPLAIFWPRLTDFLPFPGAVPLIRGVLLFSRVSNTLGAQPPLFFLFLPPNSPFPPLFPQPSVPACGSHAAAPSPLRKGVLNTPIHGNMVASSWLCPVCLVVLLSDVAGPAGDL